MSRFCIQASWDDVPHLSEEQKKREWERTPPYLRDARSKGIPQLGSGVIYPVSESDIKCAPFEIPTYWPRIYGLDVGWKRTAAIWGAWNRDEDVVYLYSEHYRGQAEPSVHAASIKARGDWIPGVIDPAAHGRAQSDGEQLIKTYGDLGLDLRPAENAVEAGIQLVWERLSAGKLKVFANLENWFREVRIYRRDDKGRLVKENDHLMDACVVGETIVQTSDGPKQIRDLVGIDGYVVTRNGSLGQFIGARRTIENTRIVKLVFENGDCIMCTPDHPFLTVDGWKPAIEMNGSSCFNGVAQRAELIAWTLSSFRKLFSPTKGCDTISAANISNEMESGCTGSSGLMKTGRKSRTASMCITRTKTNRIIRREISTCYSVLSTCLSTILDMIGACLPKLSPLLLNGMHPTPAASGTLNITSSQDRSFTRYASSSANNAAQNTKRETGAKIDSARMPAKLGRGSYLALMTRNAVASFAARVLWSIATARQKHVRKHALVRCLSVQEAGRADVYCLTVPGTSAFAVGSGLIVHNTRYLIISGLARAETKKGPRRLPVRSAGSAWSA